MVVAIVPSSLVAQRCTQIKGLEKSYPSLSIQPTRGNQVPSRGENERQREREVDTLRDAKDTERVGEREKIVCSVCSRMLVRGEGGLETEKIFLTGWRGACIYLGVVSRVHTPPARRKHAGVTTPAIIINPFSAIPPGYAYPLLLNRTAVARHAACSNRKNRASRGGTKGQSPHLQSEWKIWRNAIWRDCFPFAGGRGRNAVVPTALIDSVPLSLSRFRSTMMAEARPCRSDMTEIRREEQDRIRERIQGSEMEVKCAHLV